MKRNVLIKFMPNESEAQKLIEKKVIEDDRVRLTDEYILEGKTEEDILENAKIRFKELHGYGFDEAVEYKAEIRE